MLLVIDIGNTNTSLGVFSSENLIAHWRLETVGGRTVDEYGVLIRQLLAAAEIDYKKIHAVIFASVVPPLNFSFQKMSENYFGHKAIFVDNKLDLGLPIKYNPPSAVGADRIVDAIAAISRYGAPCIVVDFGTATNIEVVNAKGEYLGGAIAPGIKMFAAALSNGTSKLPPVEIKKPETAIGNSTIASLSTGIFYGYVGLIDGILRRMINELQVKPLVIATGGLAHLISSESEFIETIDENLALEGLRLIYEKIKTS